MSVAIYIILHMYGLLHLVTYSLRFPIRTLFRENAILVSSVKKSFVQFCMRKCRSDVENPNSPVLYCLFATQRRSSLSWHHGFACHFHESTQDLTQQGSGP